MGLNLGSVLTGGLLADEGVLKKVAKSGMLGAVPMMLRNQYEDDQAAKVAAEQGSSTAEAPGNVVNRRKGGSVSSASKRADGIAQRGKTRGKMV